MSYNSGVLVLVISNDSPDFSLNCTPLILHSHDLRSGKTKLVKNSENSHFTILYKNGVWFSRLPVTLA